MRRSALVTAAVLALATVASCGDDSTERQTVEGYLDGETSGTVEVEGFLLVEGEREGSALRSPRATRPSAAERRSS